MTDALKSYGKMGEEGYVHMAINHALRYAEGKIHTNGLENFWSLAARMIHGTYVAIEPFRMTPIWMSNASGSTIARR